MNLLLMSVKDATCLPRSSPETRASNPTKISAVVAVLRQRRPTLACRRGIGRFGRVHIVRITAPLLAGYVLIRSRIDLSLDSRLEYLTLAVGNAKSHPISVGGRHETAIAFLTDLEEKLDVAQVQLEVYNTLIPIANEARLSAEAAEKVKLLSKRLFTMSEVTTTPSYLPTLALKVVHSCIRNMRSLSTSQL
jgi:hypothetical protein